MEQSMCQNWRFHLGDVPDGGMMITDDRAWRPVTIPHDWAVEHPFDTAHASGTGYLPGGIGWYRNHFQLPAGVETKRVTVTFQGVYHHAQVWINSHYLGMHAYGYTAFTMDLSPFVRPGENVLSVRVDHTQVADSRWYTGSGIHRPVTLTITEPWDFVQDGVFVSTKSVAADAATLRIQYETAGADTVGFEVLDQSGQLVVTGAQEGPAGELTLKLPHPRLWHVRDGYLYTLRSFALKDGSSTCGVDVPFGVRTFSFHPEQGFFLNGQNLKIKGVCVHHDGGCLGAAVPDAVWARRLKTMMEAGCNAIRTAHNPPSSGLLNLCDRLGLLVMDEAFDEWEGVKNKWWQGHNVYPPKHYGYGLDYPQWHEIDLTSMVKRDRNHPSIILWSIGNEVDYPNDPYVTPLFQEVLGNNDHGKPAWERQYDPRKPDASRLVVLARTLSAIVHRLDETRPVTSAMSFPELSTRTGLAQELDVWGYNYREALYEADHARFPHRVILGSENGHEFVHWYAVEDAPYISGQFLWTGVDFLGECRGWPVRISQAGMLDLCGNEKPLFYQRRTLWTDAPFAKLAVGREPEVATHPREECFLWRGTPGESRTVSCYTNAPWAELFLNGVSLGRRDIARGDGCRAHWMVPYAEGTLTVTTGNGATDALSTALPPEKLILTPWGEQDGAGILQVAVTLAGADGNPANADEIIHYQVLGDVEILGIENGAPDDLTPYPARYRSTLDGKAMVYLRVNGGRCSLHAWTKSGLFATVEV